jgi:Rap1a immunity proteins
MILRSMIAAVALLCLTPPSIRAQADITADKFLPGCYAFVAGREQNQAATNCASYVAGAFDGITFKGNLDSKPDGFCHPQDANLRQLVRVVVKYVDDHPAEAHELFVTIIHKAMINAWPCGKSKQ